MAANVGPSKKDGFFYYDWTSAKYKWVPGKPDAVKGKITPDVIENNLREGRALQGEDVGAVKPLRDLDVNNLDVYKVDDPSLIQDRVDGREGCENPRGGKSAQGEEYNLISQGHSTMQVVLSTRAIRLKAAQTLWNKDTNEFIDYILRLNDDAIMVDVLGLLCSRIKQSSDEDGSAVSMGACLEMLPALERLLRSKYEDYIVGALDMVREMIKRWWKQLKQASDAGAENPENFRCSRSLNSLYTAIISMTQIIERLSKRSGQIGEKAKVVSRLLEIL